MKPTSRLLYLALAMLIAVTLTAFNGCSDDEETTGPEGQAPDLPPEYSFIMDFNDFPQESSESGLPGTSLDALTQENFGWSAFHVGAWSTIIGVGMIVPVAAFVESFNHDPVQADDGKWQWSYDVTVNPSTEVQYTCKLVGWVEDGNVFWEMYISKEGEFTEFMWYSGTHNLPATEGTWTMYQSPSEPNPWLGIEWHHTVSTNTGDLKYTNIVPGGAENGGYIFYGSDTDMDYDRFYQIYNKGADNLTRRRLP
jgi:hypothetical protein